MHSTRVFYRLNSWLRKRLQGPSEFSEYHVTTFKNKEIDSVCC
jgi:hypothetical protein